jgi:hypothetical protein
MDKIAVQIPPSDVRTVGMVGVVMTIIEKIVPDGVATLVCVMMQDTELQIR